MRETAAAGSRPIAVLVLGTLMLAGASAARADSWPAPRIREVFSESREYLERYHGEGIQHVALGSTDLYKTVDALRASGIKLLDTIDSCYELVDKRIPGHGESLAELKKIFRPDNPLLPNYHWVPIGYHGRASSIVVSGTPVARPNGQTRGQTSAPDAPPSFGPSRRLDFELELGFVVGPGNPLGKPVPIGRALDHVFGVTLFNDWSARDIQAWEYQPLGPFLAKSFASTMSPWIVTLEALEPFRCAAFRRADDQPAPLPYLLGSGTISGPTPDSLGSMLELTQAGKVPLPLPTGETRVFIEDGDEVILRGRCARQGFAAIGFGEAAGIVRPAPRS